MLRRLLLALPLLALAAPASAQQLVESYIARLGPQDHVNSQGLRLDTAAGVIRQDRANFHRYGNRDVEDQPDRYFASPEARATLEAMILRGGGDPLVLAEIVKGTPLVQVEIWRDGRGDWVKISLR